ncbi:MAG: nucleoside monophosphate kinase [Candidatus Pacebacteria bacterium]|nr:nucleoside monophosphate kinase [Candidatus Paceibacterota bacterium]
MLDFSKKHTFIFIGRSGCGKGTQVELLQEYIKKNDDSKIMYLETGHKFREFIQGDSFAQRLSSEIYKKSERQPDFLAVWMWSHIVVEELTGEEHLIIDGTPRSLSEAKILDTALDFFGRESVYAIHPHISRDEAERRLTERGRSDDVTKDGIKSRLDWFESDVVPAIEYYKESNKHKYIEVDGEKTIEEVYKDILEAL